MPALLLDAGSSSSVLALRKYLAKDRAWSNTTRRGFIGLLAVAFVALRASGAIASGTIWEVRPTLGSDTNGGGWVPGSSGTDYSQQSSAQYALTNGVANGTTTVGTASASADMVGNIAYIAGGTGSISGNWYQIISQITGVSITVDRSTGLTTGTGVTINVGGAWATLTPWPTAAQAGNTTWVKATGTYGLSSHLNLSISGGGTAQLTLISGYTSTRGDGGKVTINCTTTLTGSACINVNTPGLAFANFAVSANSNLARGIQISTTGTAVYNVTATGFTDSFAFLSSNNAVLFVNCSATSCTCPGFFQTGNTWFFDCYAASCQGGFVLNSGGSSVLLRCTSANNTGNTGYHGFSVQGNQTQVSMINCVAYNNGGDGFHISAAQQTAYLVQNCISYGNAAFGFNYTTSPTGVLYGFNYNAYGSNTSGNLNVVPAGPNDVTLTANPFNAPVTGDFSLNSTSGGGAACRGAGFQGSFGGAVNGAIDIGAVQSAAGGGSSIHGFVAQ
jgi:hypothetical protein